MSRDTVVALSDEQRHCLRNVEKLYAYSKKKGKSLYKSRKEVFQKQFLS